jgi:uncharacterized protein
MVVRTIVHFEIPADDAERLSEFYGRVFGWKFEKAPIPGMDYWMISTGPERRRRHVPEDDARGPPP